MYYMHMDNEQMQQIYNETFAGLTLFYRDVNLPENLISKYQVGQVIMERGYTDMSNKGGGAGSSLRYLIASAHATDMGVFNNNFSKFKLYVLPAGSYFKVLDIYTVGDKTQIFLLHVAKQWVEFFKSSISNVEKDIDQTARHNFDTKVNSPVNQDLQAPEWTNRLAFPLGMSDEGQMFQE